MKKFTIIVCIGLCGGVEVECGALFVVSWMQEEEVAPLFGREHCGWPLRRIGPVEAVNST
jgi:hypothetical protein